MKNKIYFLMILVGLTLFLIVASAKNIIYGINEEAVSFIRNYSEIQDAIKLLQLKNEIEFKVVYYATWIDNYSHLINTLIFIWVSTFSVLLFFSIINRENEME